MSRVLGQPNSLRQLKFHFLIMCGSVRLHGGGEQAPHQPKKPIKMPPMFGVDLYALEDGGYERTKNNNGIVLPRGSHQDGFESNQDCACNQQQIGNPSKPAERRKRIDVYIVRVLPEYDTEISRPKS